MSPWSYLTILMRRRWLVVGLPVAAALAVMLVSMLRPRQYVAGARFMPQESAPTSASLGNLAAQFGLPVSVGGPVTGSPAFYAELLQSKEVLRDVLHTRYEVAGDPPFNGTLLEYLGIPTADSTVVRGLLAMKQILAVSTDRTTGLVRFDVTTRSPELSVRVARRFLDLVTDYNLRRRQSTARSEREFIEARLTVVRDSLNAAEDQLAAFYRRNRSFRESPDLQADEQRLLRAARVQSDVHVSLSQRYEAAKIEEVRNTPVVTLIEPPEGFVAPVGRGLLRRGLLTLALGGLLSIGLAVLLESLQLSRERDAGDYQEFQRQRDEALRGVRALMPGGTQAGDKGL